MTLKEKIGQLFIVGFEGYEPSKAVETLIQQHRIGGIALFGRNIRDPVQLLSLTSALQALSPELPLFMAIDQEGGRVSRLKAPFTEFPSPSRLGQAGSVELAHAFGKAVAKELNAVGINVNFAPILDLDTNPQNPVIGERAFGSRPDLAARLGVAFFKGLEAQGVVAVGKHFPGHGETSADSHQVLPVVPHGWSRLEEVELHPFSEAVKAGIPALMTAHVLYPALDPDHPATLSRAILTDLLRGGLGFDGLLVSDDLEMGAIASRYSTAEAAVRFIEAGGDLLLICHRYERQLEAMEALTRAVEAGRIQEERVEGSLRRVIRAKERYLLPSPPPSPEKITEVVGCEEHQKLVQAILSAAYSQWPT